MILMILWMIFRIICNEFFVRYSYFIFIWYTTDNDRLNQRIRSLIDDGDNDILVSMASVWEMAIKHSRGMLSFQQQFMEFIRQQLTINRMELLPI